MVSSAANSMSSSTSPVSDAKITWTPAACTTGFAATEIHCNAKMMRPRPISTRPKRPIESVSRARKSTTPTKISSGESHDRSNDSTTVTSDVPTSAPSITASACDGADQPLPGERGNDQCGRRAALDQRGDSGAGKESVQRLGHADAQEAPQRAAEQAQDARADDVRAPDEQRNTREKIE